MAALVDRSLSEKLKCGNGDCTARPSPFGDNATALTLVAPLDNCLPLGEDRYCTPMRRWPALWKCRSL